MALLPVKHPLFNLREICKQCVLLEDHLINKGKGCPDCIRKHFLTIEALFEEAASLDVNQKYGTLAKSAESARNLSNLWTDGVDPAKIAGILRALRKSLTPECFDLRPMSGVKVASVVDRHLALNTHVCHLASGGIVRTLRDYLIKLNRQVEAGVDINTPKNLSTLAALLQGVDQALTEEERVGKFPYEAYARRVLRLDVVMLPLADGGYSRLTISVQDPLHVRGHSSNSDIVNRNWQSLKG